MEIHISPLKHTQSLPGSILFFFGYKNHPPIVYTCNPTFVIRPLYSMSADNPDEYEKIIEENFFLSYPEKFPGLYPGNRRAISQGESGPDWTVFIFSKTASRSSSDATRSIAG